MKIATWNINGINAREDQVLDWIEANEPDVLCLQETKVTDQAFPEDAFGDLDYDTYFFGQASYNGVALITREEARNVTRGIPNYEDEARRMIAAEIGGVQIINIYLPNGQAMDSPKFPYKLAWMDALMGHIETAYQREKPVLLCGDFNIVPQDNDHWDGANRAGQLFLSEAERSRFCRFLEWGFVDSFRHFSPQGESFSWWDYRGGSWEKNHGMRIDHVLVTASLLARTSSVKIDKQQRAHPQPSDHVPVVIEFQD